MEIDLTKSELFENLLEIKFGDTSIDLHNEFTCSKFLFNHDSNELRCHFERILNLKTGNTINSCNLILVNPMVREINVSLQPNEGQFTLDNFYRGRFEMDSKLFEKNSRGMPIFYIEFYEGLFFQIFVEKLYLEI